MNKYGNRGCQGASKFASGDEKCRWSEFPELSAGICNEGHPPGNCALKPVLTQVTSARTALQYCSHTSFLPTQQVTLCCLCLSQSEALWVTEWLFCSWVPEGRGTPEPMNPKVDWILGIQIITPRIIWWACGPFLSSSSCFLPTIWSMCLDSMKTSSLVHFVPNEDKGYKLKKYIFFLLC